MIFRTTLKTMDETIDLLTDSASNDSRAGVIGEFAENPAPPREFPAHMNRNFPYDDIRQAQPQQAAQQAAPQAARQAAPQAAPQAAQQAARQQQQQAARQQQQAARQRQQAGRQPQAARRRQGAPQRQAAPRQPAPQRARAENNANNDNNNDDEFHVSGVMPFYYMGEGSVYWQIFQANILNGQNFRQGYALRINEKIRISPNANNDNYGEYANNRNMNNIVPLLRGAILLEVVLPKAFARAFLGHQGNNISVVKRIEGVIWACVDARPAGDRLVLASASLTTIGKCLRMVCELISRCLPRLEQRGATRLEMRPETIDFCRRNDMTILDRYPHY